MSVSPVRAVRLLTPGRVRVRPNNVAGDGTPMLWWTFTARDWTDELPVHAFVVEHEAGALLWDTGAAPASAAPGYFPGGLVGAVYRRQVRSLVGAGESLPEQLAAAGLGVGDLRLAVVSHLHYDHAGNLPLLAAACVPVLVSAAEHRLLAARAPQRHGVLADRIAADAVDWRVVDFAPLDDGALAPFGVGHDVHGDGSLVLLPTPGHSAGSMSLLVRRGAGRAPLLLVGDVTYDPELLERGVLPDVGSRRAQRETAERVLALRRALPDLVVLAAHDPRAAERLAAAG